MPFGHLLERIEANRDKMSEPRIASCNSRIHIRACIAWGILIGDAFYKQPKHYLLIYLLTPCSRVLLRKLSRYQLVKKFPIFYGTRILFTAFKSARHVSLYWTCSIQSIPQVCWRTIVVAAKWVCQNNNKKCAKPCANQQQHTTYTVSLSTEDWFWPT